MQRTALLIIDMQNDFVLPGAPACVAGAQATIPRLRQTLDVFRAQSLPIVHVTRSYDPDGSNAEWTRQEAFAQTGPYVVPGTPGAAIVDALQPMAGEYRITKPRFSAFMHTSLDLLLRRLNVQHVAITGTQYPNCIRATAFDALCLDYRVTVITDACSAASEQVARANIYDMQQVGIVCQPLEAFVDRLERAV